MRHLMAGLDRRGCWFRIGCHRSVVQVDRASHGAHSLRISARMASGHIDVSPKNAPATAFCHYGEMFRLGDHNTALDHA